MYQELLDLFLPANFTNKTFLYGEIFHFWRHFWVPRHRLGKWKIGVQSLLVMPSRLWRFECRKKELPKILMGTRVYMTHVLCIYLALILCVVFFKDVKQGLDGNFTVGYVWQRCDRLWQYLGRLWVVTALWEHCDSVVTSCESCDRLQKQCDSFFWHCNKLWHFVTGCDNDVSCFERFWQVCHRPVTSESQACHKY